jgi:methylenetetrahydrofolate dehydrogenase (NADP+)/methenyltetrahydrofolate cyclohydrolase
MYSDLRPDVGAHIVDGKSLSLDIQRDVANEVSELKERGVEPHLAVVIAGDDPASQVYVRNKERACERCGQIHPSALYPATLTRSLFVSDIYLTCRIISRNYNCKVRLNASFLQFGYFVGYIPLNI